MTCEYTATTACSASTTTIWPRWAAITATSTAANVYINGIWTTWAEDSYWQLANATVLQARQLYRTLAPRVHDTDPIPAARRAEISERQRQREAAYALAEALLCEHLDEVQLQSYKELQQFLVNAPSGRVYRIRKGIAGNVDVLDKEGELLGHYCIHPVEDVPAQDNMLAQKLWIEHDEKHFRRVGNYTPVKERTAA